MHPNGLRLSGEQSAAKRVRCSRVLGDGTASDADQLG